MIKVAFASGSSGEFGLKDGLPWGKPFKQDMAVFKEFTEGCILVMGRKTFESLPSKLRDLGHVVLSSSKSIKCKNGDEPDMVVSLDECADIKEFLEKLSETYQKNVCVIGGSTLVEHCVEFADEVMCTLVYDLNGDVMEYDNYIDFWEINDSVLEQFNYSVTKRYTLEKHIIEVGLYKNIY